jgi:tetratricopeptide (TPR) repeat protein
LKSIQQGASDAQRPSTAELNQMRGEARTMLDAGLKEARSGPPTATVAAAALALVQMDLESGQYAQAAELLEDKQCGPLVLVESGHAAASAVGFAEETYRAALRAYLLVQPARQDEADRIMDAMERRAQASGRDSSDRLARTYANLGRQLQQHLTQLKEEKKTEEAARVATALESFLDRIGRRQGATDAASRIWMAETYYQLARQQTTRVGEANEARRYYEKALAECEQVLNTPAENDSAPQEKLILGLMLRKADCLRNLHRYKEAIQQFAAVLAKKPNLLEAQVAAAYTYQERGELEAARWYPYAWQGGSKDKGTGKNLIWGWARLAQVVASSEQYRNVFHEARYNQALCRYKYALDQQGEQREKYLRQAKGDIRITAQLYPDLGGEAWRDKYDALLREIQKQTGETTVGLN